MKYTVGFISMRIIHYFSLLSNQTFPLMKNKDLQIVLQVFWGFISKDLRHTKYAHRLHWTAQLGGCGIFCSLTGFKKLHRNLGE